jgi:hypothetical protein
LRDAPEPCGRAGVGAGGVNDDRGGEGKVVGGATDTLDAAPLADHVFEDGAEVEGDLMAHGVSVGEGVHDEHRVLRAVEVDTCQDVGVAKGAKSGG